MGFYLNKGLYCLTYILIVFYSKPITMAEKAKKAKPRFVQPISNVSSIPGGEALFEAKASGVNLKVKWFRGIVNVSKAPNYHSKITDDGHISLHIPEVMEEDSGDFICQVTNHLGKASCVAELVVQSAALAPSFSEQLENIEVKANDIARFTATVAGVPTPRVKWFRNDEEIKNSYDFAIRSEGDLHSLTIEVAQEEDTGTFSAVAVNQAGEAKSSASLKVNGGGKPKDEKKKSEKPEESKKEETTPKSPKMKKKVAKTDAPAEEPKEEKKEPKSPKMKKKVVSSKDAAPTEEKKEPKSPKMKKKVVSSKDAAPAEEKKEAKSPKL